MTKAQVSKDLDYLAWTNKIENFINELSREDAKVLKKYLSTSINDCTNHFKKVIGNNDTLYNQVLTKEITDTVDAVLFMYNTPKPEDDLSLTKGSDISIPYVRFTLFNNSNNSMIKFGGDSELKELNLVEWEIVYYSFLIILERHIKLTANKKYVKEATKMEENANDNKSIDGGNDGQSESSGESGGTAETEERDGEPSSDNG